jgi:hypothetical protein
VDPISDPISKIVRIHNTILGWELAVIKRTQQIRVVVDLSFV